MENQILVVTDLVKSFKDKKVLKSINMEICKGHVYGLIGKNGAGKTTFIRTITGLMKPTSGTIYFSTNKGYIGYMTQSCRFDDKSTVKETIQFFAGIRNTSIESSIELAQKLDLDFTAKVRLLSPGQQKKLQIIIAMIGEPEFYILDEPTAGLDPSATHEMLKIIQSIHKQGKTILISSHILQDMNNICTDIGILKDGKLSYSQAFKKAFQIQTDGVSEDYLNSLGKKYSLDYAKNVLLFKDIESNNIPALIKELVQNDVNVYEASIMNLEDLALGEMEVVS
ncbi:ABC transporter ATP-binding protein [[Clostridium] innocuum]|uniref:ABC transporter ATP-binding protein n=1 Tax=Clostridium innocuum TaxID=1522 RepID=UPI001F5AC144|nr:ABC transporter ATP-binding protein [[Clostridium] innocuum]MCI2988878.1 ABC transporter ATP-binding protein [[Clostridium] innocuum]